MPDVQSHWILYLCIYSIKYLNWIEIIIIIIISIIIIIINYYYSYSLNYYNNNYSNNINNNNNHYYYYNNYIIIIIIILLLSLLLLQHCVISLSVTCDRSMVFPGTPVSSPNKFDRHDITKILLKKTLNTINQTYWTKLLDQFGSIRPLTITL